MKMPNLIKTILGTVAITTISIVASFVAASAADLALTPANQSVNVNNDVIVYADIQAVSDLTYANLTLTYNTNILELKSVENGGFLGGAMETFIAYDNTAQAPQGHVSNIIALRIGTDAQGIPLPGVSGAGHIAKITFKAKAQGQSNIGILANTANEPLRCADHNSADLVIGQVTGAAVNVNAAVTYRLTVTAGHGQVIKAPNLTDYPEGTVVALTAVPDDGYIFGNWSGATPVPGRPNEATVTMDSPKTVTANFSQNSYTLSIEALNGAVIKSPDAATYLYNAAVILSATADDGYRFKAWTEDLVSAATPKTLSMDSNKNITANFVKKNPPILMADLDGNGQQDTIVNFGEYGIWVKYNDTTWTQLITYAPLIMAKGNIDGDADGKDDLIIDFGPSYGIWIFYNNNLWEKLHPLSGKIIVTANLVNQNKDEIIVDFGPTYGIWIYLPEDKTWTKIHYLSANNVLPFTFGDVPQVIKDSIVVDFGPTYGIWTLPYGQLQWTQLIQFSSEMMVSANIAGTDNDELIADFGTQYGIWALEKTTGWSQLIRFGNANIVPLNLDGGYKDLVVDFGPEYGVWTLMNGSIWQQTHSMSANYMASGDINGDGVSELSMDFGPVYGIWTQYYNRPEKWSKIHNLSL